MPSPAARNPWPFCLSLTAHLLLGAGIFFTLMGHPRWSPAPWDPVPVRLISGPGEPRPAPAHPIARGAKDHAGRPAVHAPPATQAAGIAAPPQSPFTPPVAAPVAPGAVGHGGGGALRADYESELRAALEARKHYPGLSRARMESGRARVSFTIKKDGTIADLRLSESSGYARLDQAALDTVRSLERFKPVPDEIARGDWPVTLPMDFRLAH
jgi:TonB family protein